MLCLAGCAATGGQEADSVRTLAPDATLDARGLPRGAAAVRPASVQLHDDPSRATVLYTVSPRLQSGSASSPPRIQTSFGAERTRADNEVTYRALVVVGNLRGYAGFSRASLADGTILPGETVGRERECLGAECLYVETLMLTVPQALVDRAAQAGTPIRMRILGNAAYVEASIPPTHVRALLEATGGSAGQ